MSKGKTTLDASVAKNIIRAGYMQLWLWRGASTSMSARTLNNIDEVPSHYNLTLVDQLDNVTELTDDASIPVTLSNTGAKTYLLTASRKDFVNVEEAAPKPFSITGVFPNPFNPSTTLTFSMEREGKVRGRVFNLSGQVVDTIVEGSLSAGRHSVVWDASGHASGVYIIVLESRGMRDSRKVTLVK